MDERIKKFANVLVDHSTDVQKGEIVVIDLFDEAPVVLAHALVKCVYKAGGHPIVWQENTAVLREVFLRANKETIKLYADPQLAIMKKAAAYIGIRGYANTSEWGDVPREKMDLYKKYWWKRVHIKERVKNTKWVVGRWPTPSMAQNAEMSTAAFEDFYFRVCADVDYKKMSTDMDPLVALMSKTNMVYIIGPGETDIKFSIKDIPTRKCAGKRNIPDGEVYTAPVKESVSGVIQYNVQSTEEGRTFSGIRLVFKNGKIVEESCESGDQKELTALFNTDKGSRYVGEFALGVNPEIKNPMNDILFDEKIAKSFHLTPGGCYDEASNGNESKLHWDLICIQSEEYGGGKIYFDGILVRENGIFVLKELEGLNP